MRALIGHTGFIGGNLKQQQAFDEFYDSKNIETIRGRAFSEVYCAAAPGMKWLANQQPEADRACIQRLISQLEQVSAEKIILISTIDVYGDISSGRMERDTCDLSAQSAYGRHRWELEQFVQSHFDCLIVRLPLLFGHGLKKNILFDLMKKQRLDQVNREHRLQWYDVSNLTVDIQQCLKAGITLVNLVSAPVKLESMLIEFFDPNFGRPDPISAIDYDIRTEVLLESTAPKSYTTSRETLLTQMGSFIRANTGVPI